MRLKLYFDIRHMDDKRFPYHYRNLFCVRLIPFKDILAYVYLFREVIHADKTA